MTFQDGATLKKESNHTAFKAGVSYVFSSIMLRSVSVMTTPIFARLLTTSEYGEVSTFNSWYSLLTILFTLCLNYSIGRAKLDYPNHLDEFIGSVQILSAIISGIIAAIALLFIQPVSHILDLSPFLVCLLVIYLFFTPTITFYHDAYRYRYEYKKNIGVAWYTVLSTTVLSLVLILLIKGNKALLRCIGITVPSVILSLYFWYLSKKEQILNYNREFWIYGLKLSLVLGYVLETERKLRKNKQRQGIEDAGVRGQRFGRPLASRPKDFVPCVIAYEKGEITSSEARKRLGVSETTFFNWLKAYRERM